MGRGSLLKIGLWYRLIQNLKLLPALIKDYWRGEYRQVSPWSIVVFVLGILYVLTPIDIVPDFVPIIGQIDDATILLLCIYLLEKDLQKYKNWRMSKRFSNR